VQVRVNWEGLTYTALIVVAAGMRFWDLGSRALHHDESIHGWYAWLIYSGEGYQHNPLAHGPFQFFGMAFVFLLGGASDYTLRILPAIFGSALVMLPLLLRHRLGRLAAFLAAAGIAFSPTLLYFSRFSRNDIYIAFFTLGLVICLWRYLDERKPRYLYLAALLLGLSFATQENTFIEVAILFAFLNLWLAVSFWRQVRDHNRLDPWSAANALVLIAPFAWLIAALWPLSKGLRQSIGLRQWHPAGDLLIVLGTLALPQFAAAIQVPLDGLFGIDRADLAAKASLGPLDLGDATKQNVLGFFTIVVLIAATAVVGMAWNLRVWALVAAAFYIPYVLLYTSFFTNGDGLYSGLWNSLDYWLQQQDVRRGNQPWFYYLMLLPAYEFLPLLLAAPALFYYAFKGDVFRRFLVFWVAATLLGYTLAGEKMPWVSVHTTLPVIILAAYFLAHLLTANALRGAARWASPYLLPFAAAALGLTAVALGVFGPEGGSWLWLRVVLVLAAVAGLIRLLLPLGRQRAVTVFASALVGGLMVFTLFTGVRASYQLGDVPKELLVYTQSAPDIPDIRDRIEAAAGSSGLGKQIPIVVDSSDAFTWPWAWYLRDYMNVQYPAIAEGFQPPPDAIVLVAARNDAVMQPFASQYAPPITYVHRWWFPENYKALPSGGYNVLSLRPAFLEDVFTDFTADFVGNLFDADTWAGWWDYIRYRRPPAELGRLEARAYFPKYLSEAATAGGSLR